MQVFEDFAGARRLASGVLRALQTEISELDREIAARAKVDGGRLMTVPGIGPLIAPPSRSSRRQPRPSDRGGTSPPGLASPRCRDRRAGRSVSDERRGW